MTWDRNTLRARQTILLCGKHICKIVWKATNFDKAFLSIWFPYYVVVVKYEIGTDLLMCSLIPRSSAICVYHTGNQTSYQVIR